MLINKFPGGKNHERFLFLLDIFRSHQNLVFVSITKITKHILRKLSKQKFLGAEKEKIKIQEFLGLCWKIKNEIFLCVWTLLSVMSFCLTPSLLQILFFLCFYIFLMIHYFLISKTVTYEISNVFLKKFEKGVVLLLRGNNNEELIIWGGIIMRN